MSSGDRLGAHAASTAWTDAPIAALIVGPDGIVRQANREAAKLLGATDGRPVSTLIPSSDSLRVLGVLGAVPAAAPTVCETSIVRVGGATEPVRLHVRRISLDDGGADHLLVQVVCLGDQRTTDRRLAQQRAFRSALLELSDLSHDTGCDEEFYATLVERAVQVVPGAQAGSVLVRTPGTDEFRFVATQGFDLVGLQQHSLHTSELFRDVDNPAACITREFDNSGLDPERQEWLATVGRMTEIVSNVSAPVMAAGEAVAFVSLDNFDDRDAFNETSIEMTTVLGRLIADLWRRRDLEAALRRERESFRHQALHDQLSGLANRRHLEDRIDEVIASSNRHGRPFSLLFVDVDDFKQVNDSYGHGVGDQVIVAVADRLRAATRASDTVGRWGGDEFVVVAQDSPTTEDVEALSARVLSEFVEPVVIGSLELRIGVTIGAAWTADGVASRDALVRSADAALYDAKASGKGTVRLGVL